LYSLGESKLDVNYFNFPIALKNIENNILIEILEINKYKYCFRSFLDYKNHKNLERQPYLDNAYKFNTISSSIFPYIATQIQTNYWFNILNQDHFKNEIINDFNRRRIKTNSYNEELLKIFSTTMEKKFYHFHYTIPHNPYIYNEDGSIDTSSRNLLYINKKGYLKNLKYTNKQLSFILDSFSKSKIKDNTILIIQGDHGYRGGEVSEQEKLGILNIIHLPDKNYNILNDSISNVNTFKTILNHYFN
jgi:membrane-anchored protein YejM (alkaline phosphatase superfamily)